MPVSESAFPWLEALVVYFRVTQNHPGRGSMGICTGTLLKREVIRPMFHSMIATAYYTTDMEYELFDLVFSLFDRFGRFKPAFQSHPLKRGSGVWGRELDLGNIVILDSMVIHPCSTSGSELAADMLRWFIEQARTKPAHFLIVRPAKLCFQWMEGVFAEGIHMFGTWVNRPTNPAWPIASFFFTLMGFRRIGNTEYFGLPLNHFKESYSVNVFDDYRWLPAISRGSHVLEFTTLEGEFFTRSDTYITQKLKGLQQYITKNRQDWLHGNGSLNTLLHVAAISDKPQAVRWILDTFGNCLSQERNADGETPLEMLLSKLEKLRSKHDPMGYRDHPIRFVSEYWRGHPDASVQCAALLMGLKSPSYDDFIRIQRGCTCGECIEGFLSPRMRSILGYTADTALSEVLRHINNPRAWMETNQVYLADFPLKLQCGIVKAQIRRGLAYIWQCIHDCIVYYRLPPSELNIKKCLQQRYNWPYSIFNSKIRQPACESIVHLFHCGKGTHHDILQAAAVMIFRKAMDSDRLAGALSFSQNFNPSWAAIPECRNDHEFSYVSTHCGYKYEYVPRSMKGIVERIKHCQKFWGEC